MLFKSCFFDLNFQQQLQELLTKVKQSEREVVSGVFVKTRWIQLLFAMPGTHVGSCQVRAAQFPFSPPRMHLGTQWT